MLLFNNNAPQLLDVDSMAAFVFILLLLALNGVISLIAAAFIRSTVLSILLSAVVTESIVTVYGLI